MSLIYCLISKSESNVLCEYSEYKGNFETISRTLLKKIQQDKRATFSYENAYYFHYINQEGLTYMCMCDDKFPRDTAFVFLEDIIGLFTKTYSPMDINTAIAYSMKEFESSLKDKLNYYNMHKDSEDKITTLKKGVMTYKDNVLNASELLTIRGEKMNLIVKKADSLRNESNAYYGSVSLYMVIISLFVCFYFFILYFML